MARAVSEDVEYLATVVKVARGPLLITGAGTRQSFGEPVIAANRTDVTTHVGVVDYEPSELYVRVAAGTPLSVVVETLAAEGQELCGDPPRTPKGTVGGAWACGLSGPRQVGQGTLRDHVLGCELIDGEGSILRFGGTVIKNVAGYDVTRLMVGALGTLGVLTELTLRVRGLPEAVATTERECAAHDAAMLANEAVAKGMPVTASSWSRGVLRLLLEGSELAVARAIRELGGNVSGEGAKEGWDDLRDHNLESFAKADTVWMCKVPPLAELPFDDFGLVECLGARRWFFDGAPAAIRDVVAEAGGSAILFRRPEGEGVQPVFPTPPEVPLGILRRLKQAFDPRGLLNPGRFGYL